MIVFAVVDILCVHFHIFLRSLLFYIFVVKFYGCICLFRIVCGGLSLIYCFLIFCLLFDIRFYSLIYFVDV